MTDILSIVEAPEPEFYFGLIFTAGLFIAGLIGTLVLYAMMRGRGVKNRFAAFIPLLAGTLVFAPFLFLLATWCMYWKNPEAYKPTYKSVSGHYQTLYHGATENLDLHEDGTFLQKVRMPNDTEYTVSGTWKLNNGSVECSSYYSFLDKEMPGHLLKPEKTNVHYGCRDSSLQRYDNREIYALKRGQ